MVASIFSRLGGVSSESVLRHSGKSWKDWIKVLNAAGAGNWTHREISAHLKKRFKLSPWWQSQVARGYEIAIGRKSEGRNARGEATVTATRTFAIDEWALWRLLNSPRGQNVWLQPLFPVDLRIGNFFETKDGFFGEIRTLMEARRLRLSWCEPDSKKKTYLQVHLIPRPKGKTILAFQHEKLVDPKHPEQMRRRWKAALAKLLELLDSQATKA